MTPSEQNADSLPRSLAARLRFKHLQLMLALERSGSLRTAARELHLTQSALSKALREIEGAFDARLFERTQNGLRLTEQGAIVIRGARLLLGELAHLGEETATAAGRAAGILRLGILPFIAPWLVPKIAGALQKRRPMLLLRLREERVPKLLSQLMSGELDALVTTYTVETETDEAAASLHYEILFEESFCVIAPRTRRKSARELSWRDVVNEPWILPERFTFLRRQLEEAFLRQGIEPPVPLIESSNAATNAKLVSEGLGISIVPTMVIAHRSGASVRVLPVVPPLDPTRIALICRPGMEQHPRVAALRETLSAMSASALLPDA